MKALRIAIIVYCILAIIYAGYHLYKIIAFTSKMGALLVIDEVLFEFINTIGIYASILIIIMLYYVCIRISKKEK